VIASSKKIAAQAAIFLRNKKGSENRRRGHKRAAQPKKFWAPKEKSGLGCAPKPHR
jgi:hypothetical protein